MIEALLALPDLKTEAVTVPEWDNAQVVLSEMSGAARADFETYMANSGFFDEAGKPIQAQWRKLYKPTVVAYSLADTGGMLREDLAAALAGKNPKAIDRLFKVADQLNKLSAEEHEEAEKN
jgi:hypothetical protein